MSPTAEFHIRTMEEAIRLAGESAASGEGGPFGCVIVKDGEIIARGVNRVTSSHDPTAHAEIEAIRQACRHLGSFQLTGCTIYASCEPCPMCLGAIYWARPDALYFAASRQEAAAAGFDDEHIYAEMAREPEERSLAIHRLSIESAADPFREWSELENRTPY